MNAKKITLLGCLSLLFYSFSSAQKHSIGAELGIISSANNEYKFTDYQNRRNTFYAGFSLNYHFSEKLSFTSGLHYLGQGFTKSTCYTFEPGTKNRLTTKLEYVSIPLITNFHLLKSRKLITSLGLQAAGIVCAAQVHPKTTGGCLIYYLPNIIGVVRPFNLLSVVGVGYRIFEKEENEIYIMMKYVHGLSNTYNYEPFLGIGRKNNSFLLSLVYNFKRVDLLKKKKKTVNT